MDNEMLSFVLSHLPNEWEDVPVYTKNYNLFTLFNHSDEYQKIETHFYGANISQIIRVQNPFHYGRYMLRQEMLGTHFENTVFHAVHRDDLDVALKFNCDYRRYKREADGLYEDGYHPKFYHSFSDLLSDIIYPLNDIRVLVLNILTNRPQTQCDYYITYVVKL